MTHGRPQHPTARTGGGMKVFHVLAPRNGQWQCKICTHIWPDLPPVSARTGCTGPPPANVVSITKRRAAS